MAGCVLRTVSLRMLETVRNSPVGGGPNAPSRLLRVVRISDGPRRDRLYATSSRSAFRVVVSRVAKKRSRICLPVSPAGSSEHERAYDDLDGHFPYLLTRYTHPVG